MHGQSKRLHKQNKRLHKWIIIGLLGTTAGFVISGCSSESRETANDIKLDITPQANTAGSTPVTPPPDMPGKHMKDKER